MFGKPIASAFCILSHSCFEKSITWVMRSTHGWLGKLLNSISFLHITSQFVKWKIILRLKGTFLLSFYVGIIFMKHIYQKRVSENGFSLGKQWEKLLIVHADNWAFCLPKNGVGGGKLLQIVICREKREKEACKKREGGEGRSQV